MQMRFLHEDYYGTFGNFTTIESALYNHYMSLSGPTTRHLLATLFVFKVLLPKPSPSVPILTISLRFIF